MVECLVIWGRDRWPQSLGLSLIHTFPFSLSHTQSAWLWVLVLPTGMIQISIPFVSRVTDCSCLVAQSCLTLCDAMDYSPPGSSVHEILQARIYWRRLTFPSPEDLPNSEMEPMSPVLQADSLLLSHQGSPKVYITYLYSCSPRSLLSVLLSIHFKKFLILFIYLFLLMYSWFTVLYEFQVYNIVIQFLKAILHL